MRLWSGRVVALVAALWCAAAPAFAAGQAAVAAPNDVVLVALGQWQVRGGKLALVVPLTDALTQKQKSIIGGGFTTVSQLTVAVPRPGQDDDDEDQKPFYGVRCSVKFDAWEETYDVARLDESPRTALVKQFSEYGELCLKAVITQPDVVDRLAKDGGTLAAQLVVKQTSVEEAGKIKEWLVQQQSGVMQSLFSHMLGELTLNQTLKVRVSVPPKPPTVELGGAPAPVPVAVPAPAPAPSKTPPPTATVGSAKKPPAKKPAAAAKPSKKPAKTPTHPAGGKG